jgi:hypothetical protein
MLFAVTTKGRSARYAIREFYTKKELVVELTIRQTVRRSCWKKSKKSALKASGSKR